MKLGIMQPYFFPYIGYFELIAKTDRWVVFDVVQYNAKSWMNRNRILHPSTGWQYITVPVQKAPRGTLIRDIRVQSMEAALSRILGQLNHYKKKAPFFKKVTDIVQAVFASAGSDRLVDLNISALKITCSYLDIDFHWDVCSAMGLDLSNISHPGQWALKIAFQFGADTYINPPGGREIFDPAEWMNAGIDLQFTDMNDFQYDCRPYEFIENLSVLDVLMWNGPEVVKSILHSKMPIPYRCN